MQLLAIQKRTARGIVHFQLPVGEHRLGAHVPQLQRSQPPLRHPQAGQQFLHRKGFGQVIVCTSIQGINFIGIFTAGADDDDGHVGPGTNSVNDLHPVDVGQAQIQQDDLRVVGGCLQNRCLSVGCREKAIVMGSQGGSDEVAHRRIVLHHQNQWFIHVVLPPRLVPKM